MTTTSATLGPNDADIRAPVDHDAEDHSLSFVTEDARARAQPASLYSSFQEKRTRDSEGPINPPFTDEEETEDGDDDDFDPFALRATTGFRTTLFHPSASRLESIFHADDSDPEALVSLDSDVESSEVSEVHLDDHQDSHSAAAPDFGIEMLTTSTSSSTIQSLPTLGHQRSASDNHLYHQERTSLVDDLSWSRLSLPDSNHVTSEQPSRMARSPQRAHSRRSGSQDRGAAQTVAHSAVNGRNVRSGSKRPSSPREPVEKHRPSHLGDGVEHSHRGPWRPRGTAQTQQETQFPNLQCRDQLTTTDWQLSPQSSSAKRTSLDYPHLRSYHFRTRIAPVGETSLETLFFSPSSSSARCAHPDAEAVPLNGTCQPTVRGGSTTTRRKRKALLSAQKRRRITPASSQSGSALVNNSLSTDDDEVYLGTWGSLVQFDQGMFEVSDDLLIALLADQHKQDDNPFCRTNTSSGLKASVLQRYQGPTATVTFLSNPAFSLFAPDADVVFLSHLIPKKYDRATREQFLWIFKCDAPYLPLCVMKVDSPGLAVWEIGAELLRIQSTMQHQYRHPLGPNGEGWPTNAAPYEDHPRALPVEIFELIGNHLPRDSVQSMRLVNREFERKISRYAFRSVVVPFKPKIYGSTDPVSTSKGKGKAKEVISKDEPSQTGRDSFVKSYDPNTIHVRDGMRVFEQWGPQIKKFALTFEVPENSLRGLVPKAKSSTQSSWWGDYEWPHLEYNRYEQAAKLEEKADETSTMTTAFSKLINLQEFGLSMTSALGWLNGPDVSDRVKLFNPKPAIFGTQYALPDRELRQAIEEWDRIVEEQTCASKRMTSRANRCFFRAIRELSLQSGLPKVVQKNIVPITAEIRSPIMFKKMNMEAPKDTELELDLDNGILAAARGVIAARTGLPTIGLKSEPAEQVEPKSLTPEQEEWLMEMEWAQGAFLSSWCIALLDNPGVFQCLRTFNIANLSSGLLPSLQRDDIWRALPSLENLTVLVTPDWRKVSKNEQGEVVTELVRPSSAASLFYNFLCALFRKNKTIRTLKIGYVGGGENAPGMFARNQNVIPAPLWLSSHDNPGVEVQDTLSLPHIEHFTLTNCWLAPTAATNFFASMRDSSLQTVTFNSVSLAADSRSGPHAPIPVDPASIPSRRNNWLYTDPVVGSWSDVINTITPSHGINRMRYFHGQTDMDEPPLPPRTALRSITFTSCGYVRLLNVPPTDLDQSAIPEVISGPPQCLRRRKVSLLKLMLDDKSDTYLGMMVPALSDEEEGCLKGVWGMEMGWPVEREQEKWDVREDGMGEGGLGRFSGK
ncbi:MAG: hypothetical protein Q9210_007143, partial [Variospora velana]